MTTEDLHVHVAYTSRLAAGHDYGVFGEISRASRVRNVGLGIAGVLVFDGHRFFQWLYGPSENVSALMDSIVADPRHVDVVICLNQHLPALMPAMYWRSGFVAPEVLDEISALPSGDAARMLDAIASLIERADLEPPLIVSAPPAHRPTDRSR